MVFNICLISFMYLLIVVLGNLHNLFLITFHHDQPTSAYITYTTDIYVISSQYQPSDHRANLWRSRLGDILVVPLLFLFGREFPDHDSIILDKMLSARYIDNLWPNCEA